MTSNASASGMPNKVAPAVPDGLQSPAQPDGATPAPKLISKMSKAPTRPFRAAGYRWGVNRF